MNTVRARSGPANAISRAVGAVGRRCAGAKALLGLVSGSLCVTSALAGFERTACAAETDLPAANASTRADTSNDGQRARLAFDRGLELSRQRRFAEARESFWAAFALRPHALASYNAALTCRALGDLPGALQALDTTLARPNSELTVAERQAVEEARAEVAQLLASKAAPSDPVTPSNSGPIASAAPPAAHTLRLWCDLPDVKVSAAGQVLGVTGADAGNIEVEVPPGASSITLTRAGYTSQDIDVLEPHARCALQALPRAGATPTKAELHGSKSEAVGTRKDLAEQHDAPSNVAYWLGGAGAVLAVGGAGIWLYDNQRYAEWQAAGDDAPELTESPEAAQKRRELATSIELWDKIAITSAAAGAALLIAGGIVYWSERSSSNPAGASANSGSTWVIGLSSVHFAHTW